MKQKYWKLNNVSERLNIKNQLKKKRRSNRINKKKNKKRLQNIDKQYLKEYKFLINHKQIKLNKNSSKEYELWCPSTFSLKENYDESMNFISHVASLATNKIYTKIKLIHLNLSRAKIYDLDASCVLCSVIKQLNPILKKHNIKLIFSLPEKTDSIAYKNIITTSFVNEQEETNVRGSTNKIREGLKIKQNIKFVDFNKNNIDKDDVITTDIVEMIFSNFKNKDEYIVPMGKIISEIVDNVREHSNNKSWYIVGNVIPKDEYNNSSIRLVIMNYGDTIPDTLKEFMSHDENISLNTKQKKIIDTSKEIIKQQRLFIDPDYYEEDQAYTFLAIQQGISSKMLDLNNSNKRGSGIYKLNNEIDKISDKSEPEKENCIIISGNTMIKFKNKYSYQQNDEIYDKLYQICFNKENTIFKQQDNDCIIKLSKTFPGTILYLDFNFKEELINE